MTNKNNPPKDHSEGKEAESVAEALIESSIPLLFTTYDEALEDKIKSPVLFLLDCEDAIAKEMAEAWLGEETVSDAILFQQTEDEGQEVPNATVFARPISWNVARKETPSFFPYLSSVFEAGAPKAGILVIVVADGGATAFTLPLDAR